MHVLITGGAGFIGGALTQRLTREGHQVVCVDNLARGSRARVAGGAELIEADVLADDMRQVLAQHPFDAVVHLAAQIHVRQSDEAPLIDAEQNILGTLRLLAAAEAGQIGTFVLASSGGAVYGNEAPRPTPESFAPCAPLSPYGASKLAAELYTELYGRQKRMRTVVLRLGNVYGPGQSTAGESGVIALFLAALKSGKTPKLIGAGEQMRDYVYIDDVVDAFVRVLTDRAARGIYNIGTERESSVKTILTMLARLLDVPGTYETLPARSFEVERSCLDASRARRELKWLAHTDLQSGLRRTVAQHPSG